MLKHWQMKWRGLPRDSRDTLFLLVVIGWVLLPQVRNLPVWCSLLAAGVLLWRGWISLNAKPLPGKWWRIGLLAATLVATWLSHRTLLGRDAGVTMLVVLLSLKTLELRARRDAFVVFFLAFFCMLSNFFYSQSLPTAFSMLVGLLGLLMMLVLAHLPVGKPPLVQAARTAGGMALLGAPVMVLLFVLFPRMAPLWGMPSDAMAGRSGLSPSMQVGTIASLALDDSIAMRIRFEGRQPQQRDMYFRGPVLSNFDGKQWQSAGFAFGARSGPRANLKVRGEPLNYEVTLEPTNRPWLMVMEAAATAPQIDGIEAAMQEDLQWLVNRPISDLTRYKVQSYPAFTYGPAQSPVALREFVQLPAGFNPRTLALATEILRDPRNANATHAQLVQIALDRLRTGGYSYTLEPGVYGQHTADEFWFDRKEGFCEHIASSFVILMRGLDIPARIVTGYQGGEQNSVDGFWTVRQSDAHAWAEVWQPGWGWVRVDPTSAVSPNRTGAFERLAAPRGVVAQTFETISPTLLLNLRSVWEAVNNGWNQWILNYSQGRQLDLLRNFGFASPSWTDLSYLLIGCIVAAALAGTLWLWWERTQHDPWLRLLERARRRLARAGLASDASTSPRRLAELVAAQYGPRAKPLEDWFLQLEMQRYARAPQPAGADARAGLRQLQSQFRQLRWPA
jgi:protein-glutamine gamma-glutamyltransferase